MRKIRLLIADDHTLVREGLLALMETIPDLEVIGQAADGLEAVELALRLNPDVILLDIAMPRMDGLQAISEIIAHNPNPRILIVTSFSEDEQVFQAIQLGALGYLLKDCSSEELVQAIRDVYRGEAHLQPVIVRKLMQKINRPAEPIPVANPLTDRERNVLTLVAKGLSNHKIAESLVLSERTVDAHVSNILKKLHLSNRTQIALYAIKEGGIQPKSDP
jgi:two-component system, NarL family, response regulator LiaR